MRSAALRRAMFFIAGAGVLAYMVQRAGAATIGDYLGRLGVAVVVPVVLVGIQHCLRALAWRFSVRATDRSVSYLELVRARLGAEALGYLSLTGAIGAQTSKVLLLRKGIGARFGAATVAVDAAAAAIAAVLFTGGALLAAQATLLLPAWTAAVGGALLGSGALAWLMAAIWSGQRRHDAQLPALGVSPASRRAAARDAMRLIRVGLVRLHGWPFALMVIIHVLGHAVLTAATGSILSILGISDSIAVALLFEAGAKLGNTMGVFVPARLGVFEAGVAGSANLMHLAPAAGLAVGLVRRMIDVFWVGVGLGLVTLWPLKLEEQPRDLGHTAADR